jgi:hypothetical protein
VPFMLAGHGRTTVDLIRALLLVDEEGRIETAWSPVTPEDTVPKRPPRPPDYLRHPLRRRKIG